MSADMTFQSNLLLARDSMSENFVEDSVINPTTAQVSYLLQNTHLRDSNDLVQGSFVVLPTAPTSVAANAVLGAGQDFQVAIFRVSSILDNTIEFRRVQCFSSDTVTLSAEQNATASYGMVNRPLFVEFLPVNPDPNAPPPAQWIVAKLLFQSALHAAHQPQQAVPQPILPHLLPGQDQSIVQQIGLQQSAQLSASRETTANVLAMARFQSFQRVFRPGMYQTSIRELMVGLPAGQPPNAGHFKTDRVVARLKNGFYNYAQGTTALKVTITDTKLSAFVLLDFSNGLSLTDLATPDDKPITYQNVGSLVGRICESIASIYGTPLVVAISLATTSLCNIRSLDCRDLLGSDILELLERRLHTLPDNPLFSESSDVPLDARLSTHFAFDRHQVDVSRMIDRVCLRRLASPSAPAGAKRQDTTHSQKSPSKALKTSAGSSPGSPSQTVPQADMSAWYSELYSAHPELEGQPLPCFHWLAKKAPCKDQTKCQKRRSTALHSTSGPAVAAKADITAWLLKDPLKRFL